ncbi:MAG: amidohydrolase [Chloroflexota bacterium]|nr:amidohydrolase [Chloroflexota bacterium]
MNLNPIILQKVHQLTEELFPNLQRLRRKLHQHPELSGQESWTADLLAEEMEKLNFRVRTAFAGNGLIADLVTDASKPTVALRVDMDALPIHEINEVPYRSKVPGVSHACGHDVHSTIGVGTATVLKRLEEMLPGNVRIIFQPEEEEITGALSMIHAGALKNPTPKAIFGCHVAPIPAGQIAWSDGLFLAGFDHYLGTVLPQKGANLSYDQLDTVTEQYCQAILSLNEWHLPNTWEEMETFWGKMREGPPQLQHFTVYDASTDEEEPSAWFRQFGVGVKAASQELRQQALDRIKAKLNSLCRSARCDYRLTLCGSMPDMVNHPQLVRSTLPALTEAIGAHNTVQLKAAFPFNCEDFAYYTETIPGAMYWLGGADTTRRKYAMLHTPDFDVDERCLVTGTNAMTILLIETLLIR